MSIKKRVVQEDRMRLTKIQAYLTYKGIAYQYWEEDNCGSIQFISNGLSYHVWEYPAPERGAESNVRTCGKSEEFEENYEEEILTILKSWG